MRVVLVVVSAAKGMSGVTRHATNVASALLLNTAIEHVHVVAGAWQGYMRDALHPDPRLSLEFVDIGPSVWSRNLWYLAGLSEIARRVRADLVHLAFPAPLRLSARWGATVVTLHDLYPYEVPKNFGWWKALFNRVVLRQCLLAADAIVCVSRSTLRRFDELGIHRVSCVIPNSVERNTALTAPPPGMDVDEPFLLCVAQHRRNKNILFLLKVYLHLLEESSIAPRTKLFIVGIAGPETEAIRSFSMQHALADRVVLLSALPEGQLQWCYEHCKALVAPSTVEGFGLPIVEGMLAGCRIVCSDIPAFREVGGTYCHYVQLGSGSVVSFANEIARVTSLPRPSPVNLPQYSLERISLQYVDLYKGTLKKLQRCVGHRSVPGIAVLDESVER